VGRTSVENDSLDCRACGACCVNPLSNRAEGNRDYVEVTKRDALFKDAAARGRLTVIGQDGAPYLKLTGAQQRCIGLEGKVGRRVTCTLYELRPAGCRRVNAGSLECQRARRDAGL